MSPICRHQHQAGRKPEQRPHRRPAAHLGTSQGCMIILAGLALELLPLLLLLLASTRTIDAAPKPATDNNQSPVQAIRFKMPKWVLAGADRLRLVCDYDLLGQTMHAMKLFKDNKEFYRYTPDERKLAFPVPGINVDLDRSGGREVLLRRLDRRSAGEYRCEVSVEDTFRSMSMARTLEVRSSAPQPPGASIDTSAAGAAAGARRPPPQPPSTGPWNLLKSAAASHSRSGPPEQQQAAGAASSAATASHTQPGAVQVILLLLLLPLLQVCL